MNGVSLARWSQAKTRPRADLSPQPDHPTVAFALNNLGGLYPRRHEPARAVPVYTEALTIRRARLSPTSLDVATSVTNLAIALEATGDRAGAAQRYREAIAIRTTQSGPNDASVADLKRSLARVSGGTAR